MKRTKNIVIAWTILFFGLLVGGGVFEIVTLKDPVPNNTVSHVVTELTKQYPFLPTAFVVFMGVWFVFWLTCALHWWGKGFWWKPARFVNEGKPTEESP